MRLITIRYFHLWKNVVLKGYLWKLRFNRYCIKIDGRQNNFFHRDLEEIIYMHKPKGFVEDTPKVCLLKKPYLSFEVSTYNKSIYG